MNVYLTLFAAITFEVLGTMLLPASQNFTRILPTSILIASYGMSFYMLAIISQKLPLSVVYASWSGIGIFSIAILSYIFYKQSLNWQTILGLFFFTYIQWRSFYNSKISIFIKFVIINFFIIIPKIIYQFNSSRFDTRSHESH